MALAENNNWQFQFVSLFGATTSRVLGLNASVPLAVRRGNIPIGSNAGTDLYPLTVAGPYLLVEFGLPSDNSEYVFTGRIKIYRKGREFSRDITDTATGNAVQVVDLDLSGVLLSTPRNEILDEHRFIDFDIGRPGDIWYYTIFYEVQRTVDLAVVWAFSPDAGHARNFVYRNDLAEDNTPASRHGQAMFDRLPRAWQILDYREGEETVYRLLQIFGRLFDQTREDAEQHLSKMNDVENIDAALIPYIDWLLAWPTNYELPESRRRRETTQAALLWSAKGTINALQLALQTVTGWAVEIVEGWKWVLTSYDGKPLKNPMSPPVDWNQPTDGVWQDLVEAVPLQQSFDSTNPAQGAFRGTRRDTLCYSFSSQKIVETGVGWWWQNPNGLLIVLREVPGVSDALPETVVRKVSRIAPLFAMHYAAFAIMIEVFNSELYSPFATDSDEHFDGVGALNEEAYSPLPTEESFVADSVNELCLLYSWPHPEHPGLSVSNSRYFVSFHSWLSFGCNVPPNNLITEQNEPLVTEGGDNLIE